MLLIKNDNYYLFIHFCTIIYAYKIFGGKYIENKEIVLSELADYCKSIDIDCDVCTKQAECKKMLAALEDISPYGLIKLVNSNKII